MLKVIKVIKVTITILGFLYAIEVYGKSGFTLPVMEETPLVEAPAIESSVPENTNTSIPTDTKLQAVLQLQMTPSKNSYKVGEYLSLKVQSNKDCYLTIIDIGTSGQTNVLFPNAYQQDNLLKANKVLKIPNNKFNIEIGKPAGEEVLWAVCRVEDQPLLDEKFNFSGHDFYPLKKIQDILQLSGVTNKYSPNTEYRKKVSIIVNNNKNKRL